jgi:vesicle coat complex subunit
MGWLNSKPPSQDKMPEQKKIINSFGVSSTNHSYFEKKGEINELRKVLRSLNETLNLNNNQEEMRKGLKKVIGVMTLGIDVRDLFQDVIMLSYTE